MKRVVTGLAAVASLMILMASGSTTSSGGGGNGGASSGGQSNPPANDVEVVKCGADDLGDYSMSIRITNHSSKPSNYLINVAWESSDGSSQLDTSIAAADHLGAGQNTTVDAQSFKTASGTFKCRIVDVTRYASN